MIKGKSKKIRALIFISLFILSVLSFFSVKTPVLTAFAEENNGGLTAGLEESIREQLDKLDLNALEEYIRSLENFDDTSVAEKLLDYIKGGEFSYEGFWQRIGALLFSQIAEILPPFACITAISLLSGLIATLKSGGGGNTSAEMIFLISYIAALIPLLAILTEVFQETLKSLTSMQTQMQLVFPIMLTLMAASGSAVSAAVCRPAVAFFSASIISIIRSVVLPVTVIVLVFSMAGRLTKELKIEKFTGFFKSINKWIIGVCISVFGIFFTLQGITAATYDGVVRRAAKYAIGNGIPIVGGFLSGGFDLAVAGGILIKNSLGSMSIFLMLSVLFEPLTLLIAVNLLLRLIAAITQPFGDSRISDFLGECAQNLHYCTASLLFTAFLYFLSIMIMIFSTEALL